MILKEELNKGQEREQLHCWDLRDQENPESRRTRHWVSIFLVGKSLELKGDRFPIAHGSV